MAPRSTKRGAASKRGKGRAEATYAAEWRYPRDEEPSMVVRRTGADGRTTELARETLGTAGRGFTRSMRTAARAILTDHLGKAPDERLVWKLVVTPGVNLAEITEQELRDFVGAGEQLSLPV